MTSPNDVVVWGKTTGGKTARMGRRTAAHLDWTIEKLKKKNPKAKLHVIQSAYNTGVKASAGTHDKDACLDVYIEGMGWWDQQRFLRECGWAAWYRFPPAFGHHIHMVSLGYGSAPVGKFVPGQVKDYYNHALGLKGKHDSGDDGSWFPKNIDATIFNYAKYTEEDMSQEDVDAIKSTVNNTAWKVDDIRNKLKPAVGRIDADAVEDDSWFKILMDSAERQEALLSAILAELKKA